MDWILSLLLATVRLAIPVLLISLAELYGQRAGMVNIGLEGLASIGALVGFLVCYVTGSNWLGLLCGALAGILVNMIYAFSTVTLCADHTVYGMAVNIFAPALASFIYRVYFGTGSDLKQITTMASRLAATGITHSRLEGHTDNYGEDSYNEALSLKRANSVADAWAEGAHVPRSNLVTRGLGKKYPIASNDTAAGRAENRRVTVVISTP